jgi:hypothetical protein
VFAAGNLVHPAETADVAALGGRGIARSIVDFLSAGAWPARGVAVVCEKPLRWVTPARLDPGAPPPARFLLRTDEVRDGVELLATQGERVLWREPRRTLVPNRSIRVPGAWAGGVDPGDRVRWRIEPAS